MPAAGRNIVELRVALDGDRRLAAVWGEPATLAATADPQERPAPGRRLVISRFAWLRREGAVLIAETSCSPFVVVLEDPRATGLVHRFATPVALEEAAATADGLPLDAAADVTSLLMAAGVLVDAAAAEDEPPLAVWEFHDLLFHTRSRPGRHHAPSGGTFRFAQRFPIVPAIPAPRQVPTITLPAPDWERLEREDPPLAAVQSRRSSVRRYDREPLALEQLAELLYRVARVEDFWEAPGPTGPEPYVGRPYPSGGSLYELEFYVVAQRCRKLPVGLYHYATDRHALELVASLSAEARGLLADAAAGMGTEPGGMQVLIVLTARMGRIAWKYQSLAYALVLKHVGVVLQTMYLSAAAMGLAACAVGTGDSDRFARASGIDYYAEPSVGEIAIGSRIRGR